MLGKTYFWKVDIKMTFENGTRLNCIKAAELGKSTIVEASDFHYGCFKVK